MNPQPQQLDQDVVNLTKAIRQVESGGNINARGASGEVSAYQFTPDTWNAHAGRFGVTVPLEQATMQDQNKVAYGRIKEWKDAGYNVGQVASMWHAGEGKPNAYNENWRGVNDQGVAFDTPAYAEKVAQAYRQLKGGALGGTYVQPPQTHDYQPAQMSGFDSLQQQVGLEKGGLFNQLGQDLSNMGEGMSSAYERTATGEINPASGLLQGVGAGAGLVGDVIDTGLSNLLSNLPVVGGAYEKATDVLGKAVGGAMDATGASDWMAEHPEAAGNIGAGLDILSVIPFFKALKYGKNGLRDVTTGIRAGKFEKGAAEELTSSLTKPPTRTLNRAESRGLDPMGTIVKNKDYLPEIIESNGKFLYDTKASTQKLQSVIDADEKALQNLLASRVKQKGGAEIVGINLGDVKKTILNDLLPKGKINVNRSAIIGQIDRIFEDIGASAGRNYISLNELNDIKRQIRKGINFDAIDPTRALTKEVQFDAGQSVMRQIEQNAKKAGIEGVKDINQKMANDISALNILEFLDQRPIKAGGVKNGLIKSVAKTIPGVEGIVDYASRGAPLTPTNRLKSRRPLLETGRKGLVQLGGGLGLSGQLGPEQ